MCEYQVTDMTKRDILHQGFSVTINKALYRITDVTKRDILHQDCVLDPAILHQVFNVTKNDALYQRI